MNWHNDARGGSRGAATSKMERFVIIVNGSKPLTIILKRSILDVAAALNQPVDALVKKLANFWGKRCSSIYDSVMGCLA